MASPPLAGLRILEMAGIGPGPFCGMMLADHGAEVIRVERPGASGLTEAARDPLLRSRRTIMLDLKKPEAIAAVRRIAATCDGLIEGFRPGVMERLGLGPEALLADNPKLVYGRMTGWGQTGPLASEPGHDIDYIAISGTLHALGEAGRKPVAPMNLVGDFGGGGMMLAFGMVSALLHAQKSGEGQVIDCAMTDGAALLMSMIWTFRAQGTWRDERGVNLLDTGAHFYDTYETADGKFISIGSIEPQFYAALLKAAGLADNPKFGRQMDESQWGELKSRLTQIFLTKTRDEWCGLMEGRDVCFAPVLSLAEAPGHPHNVARRTFVDIADVTQPAPAPRYSKTCTDDPRMPSSESDYEEILGQLGYGADHISILREMLVVS